MLSFSDNALKVLERRYLAKGETGELLETPEELFRRVAKAIAAADLSFDPNADIAAAEQEFYEAMTERLFMPNSPTLMNAGRPLGQLSACFVLPVGDSMEEIFDAVKNAALIHKSGGGTGFSFSRLRPAGSSVRSTGGVASGPISFMRVFNAATEAVKQGGTRRGANMGILRVDHPDILAFIKAKSDNSDITNFNISIGLTEAFMQAVQANLDYELVDPYTRSCVGKLSARKVFAELVEGAWRNGEPGIVFLDRLNRDSVTPHLGEIEATNPCGEQPLLPYESCNLGSINLDLMLSESEAGYELDYGKLALVVDTAVHFLDNVIEANQYPLPEITETTRKTRKIGLGVMGFADMLFKLGVPYNSGEALALAESVMEFIQARAKRASRELAEKRGPFPAFGESTLKDGAPLRNATVTTIAPTGTISIICGASSGVEPLFAVSFVRNVMDNDALPEVHPYFERVAKARGFYSAELMRKIAQSGTIAHIEEIPADVRRVFATAHDISPEYHIRMQAAFQAHTDNAVSKTVNFPHEATRADVAKVFLLAFELGCKGVTIYRDGSRSEQVLNIGEKTVEEAKPERIAPRPRPETTRGITEKVKIGCGNLYITVNYDDEGVCEVFTNLGRAGGCPSQSEATSRLISTALRSGMDVETLAGQLKGIRCHSTLRQRASNRDIKVLSCPDAIGRVLEKVVQLQNGKAEALPEEDNRAEPAQPEPERRSPEPEFGSLRAARKNGECPECGQQMDHEGGCVICRGCGYSKCG